MENEKDIINQTANFVRSYHSKFSNGLVTPDKEGLKMLAGVYHIAQKYRLQAQKNYYKDEYGAACWHNDFEFYRNVSFILAWCDKFTILIPPAGSRRNIMDNERAKKYFPKAIEAGLMEKTNDGYKWLFGGVTRLGYFIRKVFNPDRLQVVPYKGLEQLFGVTKLDNAIDRAETTKKPQPWRKKIDELFE